ncbi:MAG: ATPase domain-containing protein [Spirochaetaceae bacterium]
MATTTSNRLSSGIEGLDIVLGGGYPEGRILLVRGVAGTGKTTAGLQFLRAGALAGKRCLCITLLQTLQELEDVAASHGWTLDGIDVMELPAEVRQTATAEQTVFSAADIELREVTDTIEEAIQRYQPECLVIDSLSELGALVNTGYQLRRQVLRLKEILDAIQCTTLLSAGPSGELDMETLETLVHGVLRLEMIAPSFGRSRRRVLVSKMRGMQFTEGYHDARIDTGVGLAVFPRLLVGRGIAAGRREAVPSGNTAIDALLGEGLLEGTTCAITGTTGAGKSSLVGQYIYAAGHRGVSSVVFCFDERPEIFVRRAAGLGMPLEPLIDEGLVRLRQIDVGEISPGQLNHLIRTAVEVEGVRIVVLDSLSGYLQSMPGEHELITQLHDLLSYLSGAGVLSLMVVASHGVFGRVEAPIDVSYIADTVVMLRHFESRGRIRRCIAVLKKRYGNHETTIREVQLGPSGLVVGEPLTAFTGVLTGLPRYEGDTNTLLDDDLRPSGLE